jgi:hypothetical protein
MPDSGMKIVENAGPNLAELFRAQPLALGALGLAVGAGLAAALPATETEAKLLGEASAAVKEKSQAFATAQAENAGKVAENVFNAVNEEARNQGLTLEDAKFAARDVTARVKRVVGAAGASASDGTGIEGGGAAQIDPSSRS